MNLDAWRQRALHWWSRLPGPLRRTVRVGYEAVRLWVAEDGSELGASIAFYSMFALAPLLVVAIALASTVFGAEAARGQIVDQIGGLVGHDAAEGIEKMIASAWRSDRSGLAAVIGVITLLVGASGVFSEMHKALNRIGRVVPKASAIGAFVRARLTAFALVLGFGFLIVASLLLSAGLAAVTAFIGGLLPELAAVLNLFDFVLSAAVLTVAFAIFLRWLPDGPPRWRSVWIGAFASALLFALGKHLIGLYLGRVSASNSFGAAGSLAVVMLWVYYSSQILLFGAAVAWALDGVRAEDPHPVPTPAEREKAREAGAGYRSDQAARQRPRTSST
jgi:membrane protein